MAKNDDGEKAADVETTTSPPTPAGCCDEPNATTIFSMNELTSTTSPNHNAAHKEKGVVASNKNSRTQHELMAMMVERNIQTAGG